MVQYTYILHTYLFAKDTMDRVAHTWQHAHRLERFELSRVHESLDVVTTSVILLIA